MRTQYHTRTVGADRHSWNVRRLVRLSRELPISAVPLTQIAEADELWWYQDETDVPTPRSVSEHMRLVAQTDLQYPIILCSEGRLMDGMHRVVKALLEDCDTIDAVQFPKTPAPDFINADINALPYHDEEI